MIIGTAGHIDHGKTSLVRALTGVDTDRLKEEKERGISIELGYAYQPVAGSEVLGFVDVPGHERFVHTMLAGATGIDFALIVIALDDGVMPQTREHVQILDLLGVNRAAIVLTKADRADAARTVAVAAEATSLLEGTSMTGARMFAVSNLSGEGVTALLEYLHAEAYAAPRRSADGYFRLAVDRCFTLPGAGTVVTGTVFSGEVRLNDVVQVSPSALPARVRSIHAQNRPAEAGRAGMRCALNLTGPEVSRAAIHRGDWIVAPPLAGTWARVDTRVRVLPTEKRSLAHWSPVCVHLGAGRTAARVALLDKTSIAPGDSGLAQLVLEAPLGAFHGDRFVLRDPGASRTLAGGTVIEPGGPARRRRTPQRLAVLAALEHPAHEASLERLLPLLPQGLDIGHFCATRNVVRSQLKLPASAVLVGAQRAFEQGHWETFKVQVTAELTRFHTDNEDELGPERGRFRRMLFPQLEDEAWNTLLDELARDKRIELSGAFLHLPGHRAELSAAEQALARDVLPLLLAAPFDPPWVRDIAAQLGADERTLRKLLLRLVRRGEVFQVVRDLFYVRSAVAELSNIAKELQADTGQVLAAEFRDRIGVGRKRAVQILEFFDRIGYLRRVRDAHRVRGVALLGEPPAAPG